MYDSQNSLCAHVCRLNEDEFLPVDLCVMLGHQNIAQILLKIGAKDSPKCKTIICCMCTHVLTGNKMLILISFIFSPVISSLDMYSAQLCVYVASLREKVRAGSLTKLERSGHV